MMRLLHFVPKHALSRLVGRIAHARIPFLSPWMVRLFARFYHVNQSELLAPLASYQSLGEFFIRDISPQCRPLGEGVVSPVDGKLTEFGAIEEGRLLQVKGVHYSVAELLGDAVLAERFASGFFCTLYLAPHNYHQIHMPVDGEVRESIYIPGELWPVNSWSVKNIPGLFARNERVTSIIQSHGALLAVVKVGATNVGSISVAYDNLRTNLSAAHRRACLPKLRKSYTGVELKKGAKLGAFHLGSTVVLLFEQGRFVPRGDLLPGDIRLGQTIGTLISSELTTSQ